VLYGIDSKADITAENVSTTLSGSAFDIRSEFGKLHIESKLIGRHNVYNILSCVSSLLYAGIGRDKVIQGIMKAGGVPGRLELIESRAPFKVFVDYAHKPNALENVLNCLKAVPHKRMICVFGCGGNRDRTKRPVMGQIAVAKSDMAIVTSDNPRDEDPEAIIREIVDGIKGCGNYRQVTAREEAIKEALHFAGKDDIVLIAGKGHEDYQIAGGRTVHFDDREIAAKELRIMGF
jgi:UDP-N-acetylmuramyl-tripeptide synthetase